MSSQAPRDRAHNRPTICDLGGGRYLTIPTEAHPRSYYQLGVHSIGGGTLLPVPVKNSTYEGLM
jgi:hypothetical protein